MCKCKSKVSCGLICGIGLIALLVGVLTDIYTTTTGVIIALAIWIIGGALAKMCCKGKKEEPKSPEQTQ